MYLDLRGSKRGSLMVKLVAILLTFAFMILTTGAVYDKQLKKITVIHSDVFNGSQHTASYVTKTATVSEFLTENKITLADDEVLSVSEDDTLFGKETIYICKGKHIFLNLHGDIKNIIAVKKTVSEVLNSIGFALNTFDVVEPDLDTKIAEGMSIAVTRVEKSIVYENIDIPFDSVDIEDNSLGKGLSKVKTEGENGIKRMAYQVTTVNGTQTEKVFMSEQVVKQPISKEILVGTKENEIKGYKYSKKLNVQTTAYTATGNRTATGMVARVGVVAVDPKVIPLGSKLYIESADGGKSWSYGYCIAGDTGGAIKGNIIDLYYNTRGECINHGRRSAVVYVLD